MEKPDDPCLRTSPPLEDDFKNHVKQSLQNIQHAQAKLNSSIERLILLQHDTLIAQKEFAQSMTAHLSLRDIRNSCAEPLNQEKCFGLRLDAGRRLVQTSELLEMCLLNLPNEHILLVQRVSRQLSSVINGSSQLQKRLFFAVDPAAGWDFRTTLNPIFTSENLRSALPLFFDHREKRLAFCYRDGRTRLYCRSVTATTVWIYMDLSSEIPPGNDSMTFTERKHRTRLLEVGSWKRMYVSQPNCSISWRVHLTRPDEQRRRSTPRLPARIQESYTGTATGITTMDTLLDGLASSSVEGD